MSLSDGNNDVSITVYGRGHNYVYTDVDPKGWAFIRIDGTLRLIVSVRTNQFYYWITHA